MGHFFGRKTDIPIIPVWLLSYLSSTTPEKDDKRFIEQTYLAVSSSLLLVHLREEKKWQV